MKPESTSPPAERCPTGIAGLDEILGCGLPHNRLCLVQGHPGVGKPTLALQFLLEGMKRGEQVLYITFSETREELERVAQSHGWDLRPINLFEMVAKDTQLRTETNLHGVLTGAPTFHNSPETPNALLLTTGGK